MHIFVLFHTREQTHMAIYGVCPHSVISTCDFPDCISVQGCAGVVQVFRQWKNWVMLGSHRHTAVLRRTPPVKIVCVFNHKTVCPDIIIKSASVQSEVTWNRIPLRISWIPWYVDVPHDYMLLGSRRWRIGCLLVSWWQKCTIRSVIEHLSHMKTIVQWVRSCCSP